MLLGSICDIHKVGIERLACGESKWSLKGNMMNSEKKRWATRIVVVPDVECRVECRVGMGSADVVGGARNVIEGREAWPRSAEWGCGAPI